MLMKTPGVMLALPRTMHRIAANSFDSAIGTVFCTP
jgi:hypothetical protein